VGQTNLFVDPAGGDKKLPVKRFKPRIPNESSGLQYNFCKNLDCSQFRLIPTNQPKQSGKKKSYNFVSSGKNSPLLSCNVCLIGLPLKSNYGFKQKLNDFPLI